MDTFDHNEAPLVEERALNVNTFASVLKSVHITG
jgi:hypothetical protein